MYENCSRSSQARSDGGICSHSTSALYSHVVESNRKRNSRSRLANQENRQSGNIIYFSSAPYVCCYVLSGLYVRPCVFSMCSSVFFHVCSSRLLSHSSKCFMFIIWLLQLMQKTVQLDSRVLGAVLNGTILAQVDNSCANSFTHS